MTALRYVHAGDLDTVTAHALDWKVGITGARYQEIAIAGDRVVGSWSYDVDLHRGRWHIDSSHTEVLPRYRRRGVARALWFAGIARWRAVRINSTIGSDEGRDFLARMIAELAYRAPDLFLQIRTRTEDEGSWERHCNWAAQELLKKLGKSVKTKAVEARPQRQLKAVD